MYPAIIYMSRNRNFKELNAFENWGKNFVDGLEHPSSWFTGPDSNPFSDPKKFESVRKKDDIISNDIIKPVENKVTGAYDWAKDEAVKIENGIVTGFRDIKDEFAYVGSEVKIGFEKTEQGIEWGYTNIVKPLAIDTITLLESTVSTINWLVANRTLVLVAVGSYGAFRFINEAKMAIK